VDDLMNDDASTIAIITMLQKSGLTASKIVESNQDKRADIWASDETDDYVIEVKNKAPFQATTTAQMEKGKVLTTIETQSYEYRNGIDAVLSDAAKQLESTIQIHSGFQLTWINPMGADTEMLNRQILFTWYGVEWLGWKENDSGENVICLYFTDSSSFKNKNVVGLVMEDDDATLAIYLNEFCPDLHLFRITSFYKRFERYFDPVEQVATGQVIAYTGSLPRSNQQAVLAELRKSDERSYYRTPLDRHTISARHHTS
jgi:hypothetical protein